jgi:pimeloyl-ACP methyl ester carboxylesterase
MHHWIGGDSAPVVLLHGFGATALWQWHRQLRALRGRQLIIPNLFGFGASVPKVPARSLEFQAEAVIALTEAIGVKRFDLVGMSYGGFVANRIAALWPDRVNRLALVVSPGGVMNEADYERILNYYGIDHIAQLLLPRHPQDVKRLINLAWHRPMWVPGFALRDAHRTLFAVQPTVKRELLDELLLYLQRPSAMNKDINHAPLLVWGEYDPLFPVELGERMRQSFGSGARLEVVERTAHAPNLERAKAFNTLLLDHLQR